VTTASRASVHQYLANLTLNAEKINIVEKIVMEVAHQAFLLTYFLMVNSVNTMWNVKTLNVLIILVLDMLMGTLVIKMRIVKVDIAH
jgi:hypothetical protein